MRFVGSRPGMPGTVSKHRNVDPPSSEESQMNPVRLAVIGYGVLAAVTALALWLPHLAGAAPDPHENAVLRDYSYNGGSHCASRKDYSDPIGVLFLGDYAAFDNDSDQIGTHTDWDNAGGGSPD